MVSLALCILPDLLPPNYDNGALLTHQPKTKMQQQCHISWTSSWVFSRLNSSPQKKSGHQQQTQNPTPHNPLQAILPPGSQNEAVMFHQEKFDMALKDLGPDGLPRFPNRIFFCGCRVGLPGETKRCGKNSFRQKDFGDRFFWMLLLCDLDLFQGALDVQSEIWHSMFFHLCHWITI